MRAKTCLKYLLLRYIDKKNPEHPRDAASRVHSSEQIKTPEE